MKNAWLLFLALFVLPGCMTTIDPGHVGVVTEWGKVQPWTFSEGTHSSGPSQTVYEINVQTQALDFSGENHITVLSKDRLDMNMEVTVQYALARGSSIPKMFRQFFTGDEEHYTERVVIPAAREAIRDVVSQMNAMDTVQHRNRIGPDILAGLQHKVANILRGSHVPPDAIDIIEVQVRAIVLPQNLRASIAAIQERQNAALARQQQIEVNRQESEANRIKAEGELAVARIDAQRDADAARIRAEGQAEANRLLAASLSAGLLEQQRIAAQRELARHVQTIVMGGGNTTTVLPLPAVGN
jgi:regulator of protease activity HflC (stomatin/prohibitin superfamily)